MKKLFLLATAFCISLTLMSCSRTLQTASLCSKANQNSFIKAAKDSSGKIDPAPIGKIPVSYVLKEDTKFSIDGASPVGRLINSKISKLYSFKSDILSEHEKTMIDTFIKDTILSDSAFVLRADGPDNRLLVISYMRSYSYKKMLYFDIFDFKSGDQLSRLEYEYSNVTNHFEQKK